VIRLSAYRIQEKAVPQIEPDDHVKPERLASIVVMPACLQNRRSTVSKMPIAGSGSASWADGPSVSSRKAAVWRRPLAGCGKSRSVVLPARFVAFCPFVTR
jgi:hypothetical protein